MIGTDRQYISAQKAYDNRMPDDDPECPECGAPLIIDDKGAKCDECGYCQDKDEFE